MLDALNAATYLGMLIRPNGTGRLHYRAPVSRTEKLCERLGWQAGRLNSSGGKPKGMHWEALQELRSRHNMLVQVDLHDICSKLGFMHKLLDR